MSSNMKRSKSANRMPPSPPAEGLALGRKAGQKFKLKVNLIVANQWLKAGSIVNGSLLPVRLRQRRYVDRVTGSVRGVEEKQEHTEEIF
jgi:hypothetical protein